jgi:L-threonylcarbamoyladenylate synthase
VKTRLLTDASEAGRLLASGALVAVPTETVYGLAACVGNENALQRIFTVKGRPSDNPLIVHIAHINDLPLVCEDVPSLAYTLAETFWPGPLSLVLKKKPVVSDFITAGLDTVAVRLPGLAVTRDVISAAGMPLAAPSANRSGCPSPTTAGHVMKDLDGQIEAVLDGGACTVGVESTVVDLTVTPAHILRPGGISEERLRQVMGDALITKDGSCSFETPHSPVKSPGMKYRHYAPKSTVLLYPGPSETAIPAMTGDLRPGDTVLCFNGEEAFFSCPVMPYGPAYDGDALARNLFAALRTMDGTTGALRILVRLPEPLGVAAAVTDRLRKAASLNEVPAVFETVTNEA